MSTFFTRAVANLGYVNLGREQPQSWGHQSVIMTNNPLPKLCENEKKTTKKRRVSLAPHGSANAGSVQSLTVQYQNKVDHKFPLSLWASNW